MANEIALTAIELGAQPEAVLAAVGSDPRIGDDYLLPGLGFGGPCLPKDIGAMRAVSAVAGSGASVFAAALELNAAMIEHAAGRAERYVSDHGLRGVCVAGVAFKPRSDSVFRSPAMALVQCLLDRGIRVSICDPLAEPAARAVLGGAVEYVPSLDDVPPTDLVLLTHPTAHPEAALNHLCLDALARPLDTRHAAKVSAG
jgi:UDPglucose 6-dehydrogenase